MNQFVKHLKRCAVCGSTPKIHYVYEHGHHYKLFCSKNAVHNSTGEWFSNKYQACLDWNARQQVRKVAKQKENLQLLHSRRSLLFRGQQRRKGEKVRLDGSPMESSWFYGSGVLQGKGDFSVIYQTEPNFDKHAVYTDTIGQYTDAIDRNSNQIFEGDILQNVETKEIVVAKWSPEHSSFLLHNITKNVIGYMQGLALLEVVGNIYDNPEFLEKPFDWKQSKAIGKKFEWGQAE